MPPKLTPGLFALFVLVALPSLACVTVQGDRIRAKELAEANPAFASLDPDLEIGYAPRAGVTRLFRAEEQVRLAAHYSIATSGSFTDVCFSSAPRSSSLLNGASLTSAGLNGASLTSAANRSRQPDIQRGEHVTVDVSVGAAHLTFQAEAASAGLAGDSVLVKNPESGHLFQAKVQAKGKVAIEK